MITPWLLATLAMAPADSLFAVLFRTGPAWRADRSPTEQEHFQTHSRNLGRLRQEGRIVLGGRYGEVGLIVVRAANRDEARGFFAADSSVAKGVFTAEILPWRTLFPGAVPAPSPSERGSPGG